MTYEMIKKIANEVLENGYIDDHTGDMCTTNVVAIYSDENLNFDVVYADENCAGFSVNPFYIKDGKAHLSRASINGNVYVRKNGGLKEAIKAFNRDHSAEAHEKTGWAIGALELVYA